MLEPGLAGFGVKRGSVFLGTLEHRCVENVLVYAVNFGKQFPGPVYGLGLEVVAETPVAEHLEHRVVVGIVANLFKVVMFSADSQALLRVGRTRELGLGVA